MRDTTPELEMRARQLRQELTPAETVLWQALRRQRIRGVNFRRQHPLTRFVLDFYCPARRLCVEVDGEVHDQQAERDAERTAVLEAAGIRVIRFRNEEVLADLSSVLRRIRTALDQQR
ncbi:MAG TPA: endonuclease domain-containing protein [Longimicrobiaceae bacterium]|nr:endonuclease domain-containing protein [Longimicrobiaceae bacterium]